MFKILLFLFYLLFWSLNLFYFLFTLYFYLVFLSFIYFYYEFEKNLNHLINVCLLEGEQQKQFFCKKNMVMVGGGPNLSKSVSGAAVCTWGWMTPPSGGRWGRPGGRRWATSQQWTRPSVIMWALRKQSREGGFCVWVGGGSGSPHVCI